MGFRVQNNKIKWHVFMAHGVVVVVVVVAIHITACGSVLPKLHYIILGQSINKKLTRNC